MAPQSLILPTVVLGALLFECTTASTTFRGNCSLPVSATNYVAGPNTRGTLSILWECILVIVLCTWSILHLNVSVILPEPEGWKQTSWRLVEDSRRKARWMLMTVFWPEYIIAKAVLDWQGVGRACDERFSIAPCRAQAHLAEMGYFVLDTKDLVTNGSASPSHYPSQEDNDEVSNFDRDAWIDEKYEKVLFLGSGGYRLYECSPFKPRFWALNLAQWREISKLQPDLVDFPVLPYSQLQQLSGQDALVTSLAIIQLSYLIAQLSVRKYKHLPSSQLEIATLAFAACSVFLYILYWNRPQNVHSLYTIKPKRPLSPKDFRSLVDAIACHIPMTIWAGPMASIASPDNGPYPIANDATSSVTRDAVIYKGIRVVVNDTQKLAFGLLLSWGGLLFGGLHCLAWNFTFPTPAEAWLWKISSVATAIIPMVLRHYFPGQKRRAVLMAYVWGIEGAREPDRVHNHYWFHTLYYNVFVWGYTFARVFILVESVRTLFFLPPEAFKATWAI